MCNTKHGSDNRIPEMGLKDKYVSFWSNLHSFGKTTITFSANLRLKRFKSPLKANTLKYLPTRNHSFWLGRALPVYCQSLPCFLEISNPHQFSFLFLFHINSHLKPFQITKNIIVNINTQKMTKSKMKQSKSNLFTLSLHEHDYP